MLFGWGVDGYGRFHICLSDSSARFVLFCPIHNSYLFECIEILEEQENGKN
jgi:hypothetical protein